MKLTLEHFNGSGKRLARAIGVEATYKLLEQYGGQSFYISRDPKPSHAASKKLGLATHRILSESWPDMEFELPVITYIQKRLRNDEILQDTKTLSMREMVAKYTMTRSQLQVIIRNHTSQQPEPEQTCETEQLKLNLF